MQLEVDILNQELATARRQTGEMERQVNEPKHEREDPASTPATPPLSHGSRNEHLPGGSL